MTARRFYTVEWPSNLERTGELVCALLNGTGGSVFFGMTDENSPVGVIVSDERTVALNAFLRTSISPAPCVMFATQEIKGKKVFEIEVAAGSSGPYFFNGRVYLMEDGKLGYAAAETVRNMVLRSDVAVTRWEERYSVADCETDVDGECVRQDFDKIIRLIPEAANVRQVSDMLTYYGVWREGRLTNAGDVLFGRHPDMRSPQVRVRAFTYRTDKSDDKFLDSKIISGPLFSVIAEAEQFIARNTHSPQDFTTSPLVRESETCYPPYVIREALVNAVAHRDYSSVSGGVSINIYPNRLEIWNAGDLPEGVSVEDLGHGQVSVLRNPTIAYALHLRGYMEQAGRGSLLMCRQCEELGLPRPEWNAQKGKGVTIVFKRVISSYQNDTIAERVLATVRRYPGINRDKLSEIMKISSSTTARAIRELKDKNLVSRQGGPRYGGYFALLKRDTL